MVSLPGVSKASTLKTFSCFHVGIITFVFLFKYLFIFFFRVRKREKRETPICCLHSLAMSFLKKIFFIDYVITVVPVFSPLPPSAQYPHSFQQSPLSSCPWVVYISSLASPFPILFLTSPLSILYLPFMLLSPWPFSSFFPL